jgi:hypothetical protein
MLETIKAYDLLTSRLNEIIRGLKAHPRILDKEEHKYLYPVFEKAIYIAIAASDLNIGLKYLDVSNAMKNGYEANYFARNVAHISYELINHQKKIVGPDVSNTISDRLVQGALLEIKACTQALKDVTKRHHTRLKYIRNNMFGHRTANGSEMAESMLKIDNNEIYQIGKQVFNVYIQVIGAYSNLLKKL